MSPEVPLREETAVPRPKVCGYRPPSAGGFQALMPCSAPFFVHWICKLLVISQHSAPPSPPGLGSSVREKIAAFRPLHTDPCQRPSNGLVLQEGGRVLLLFMQSIGKERCG